MVQWDRWHLWSAGKQRLIPGPAWWVKDEALVQLQCRLHCSLDLIPGLETPCVWRGGGKKEKKKKKKKKKIVIENLTVSHLPSFYLYPATYLCISKNEFPIF